MTLAEIERAEKNMQQQWYDLVMAEQQGKSLEVLEQMYDTYILLAEEYYRCYEAYQRESQAGLRVASPPKRKSSRVNLSSDEGEGHIKLAS
jgi:hypothetical protein